MLPEDEFSFDLLQIILCCILVFCASYLVGAGVDALLDYVVGLVVR